ncbi:Nucleotidyltransferase family protein [Thalictrum thalictroides]|uniref:Nucleotidyltransferase family protein n=1 Tax=Thalictrum thalictroides TaxID=46969 RepID=A0A7J6V246_THATH|nr:Nucleotidyltransferase family protein [Thalictrum thalictroides]
MELIALSRALSQKGIAKKIQDAVSKSHPLPPLCLTLKVFLQQRKLNEVCSGGVGSYALLTMLIAQLQVDFFEFTAES